MNPFIEKNLEEIKKSALVLDIETASFKDGREVNIRTDFDDYIKNAKVKWFGAYSYQDNKTYLLNPQKDSSLILQLLREHNIFIGFNCDEFDLPILVNNGFIDIDRKYLSVDCKVVLGTIKERTKDGYSYKNRAELMNVKLKNNHLRGIAESFNLETQKGNIDYKIFFQNQWSEEETEEIKRYLEGDILATKQLFDRLWDFWFPFTEFLDENSIYNLSWIRSSIASLTYKAACHVYGVTPTYSEIKSSKEEMGGRVIEPKYEEMKGVWYVDFASLYPHIFSMFNLFSEVNPELYPDAWHGNDMFEVKGYYDISSWNLLSKEVSKRLEERIKLKETDKTNPMIYALKIFLNSLYGCARSPIFERVHTPNCGWDCCWLGQQIHNFTEDKMTEFGFETIAGDSDSLFVKATDDKYNTREYVKTCLEYIVKQIKDNVPFPVKTFKIDIEDYLDYIMWPFSEQPIQDENGNNIKKGNRLVKVRKGRKKNYLYICGDKIKLVGLPIMKDNATSLSITIYEEVLKPLILKNKSAKFDKEFIQKNINEYLAKEEVMELMAREYKVNKASSYKLYSQIQAQISANYFSGESGTIKLIKNNKIGKVGKGQLYCTIQEALSNSLTADDLDLEKVYNELEPFIKHKAT